MGLHEKCHLDRRFWTLGGKPRGVIHGQRSLAQMVKQNMKKPLESTGFHIRFFERRTCIVHQIRFQCLSLQNQKADRWHKKRLQHGEKKTPSMTIRRDSGTQQKSYSTSMLSDDPRILPRIHKTHTVIVHESMSWETPLALVEDWSMSPPTNPDIRRTSQKFGTLDSSDRPCQDLMCKLCIAAQLCCLLAAKDI